MPEVDIYTTPFCGFCYRAKALLDKKGVRFTEIDVTVTPGARQEMMERAGGQRKVPQIFVDGRHVGGCEELFDLESRGALDSLLGAPPEPEGAS
ncbi:MAG: glutaredoxin 3 [Rhodospirillales bacterium]